MTTGTLEGLQNFGAWFRRSRTDSSCWPYHLRQWFETHYGFSTGQVLTQEIFGIYLSEQSGQNLINRIKTVELWADIKTLKDTRSRGLKYDFALIIAQLGILQFDGRSVYVDDIGIFEQVLKGQINPLHDKWPLHPIGKGLGKRLAIYLEGLALAANDESLFERNVSYKFFYPSYSEKDIDRGGFIYSLLRGNIFDVGLSDIRKISGCIESYLRTHLKSSKDFGPHDLLTILRYDDRNVEYDIMETKGWPNSALAIEIYEYCAQIDTNVLTFVRNTLGIDAPRWKELENGAKPFMYEIKTMSTEIGKPEDYFKDLWADQYGPFDDSQNTLREEERKNISLMGGKKK